MLIYLMLYIIALTGYAFNVNKSKKSRRAYVVFLFLLIIVTSALRHYTIGTDLRQFYSKYYAQFAAISWDRLQSVTVSGDWELGFCAFNKIFAMISPEIQMFIAASSVVSILPFAIFIYKNCDDVVFGTTFFLGFHIFSMSLNIVRQAMAVGILLLGFEALKKKKYITYSVFVIMAVLFHTSAIIGFIYIIIDNIEFKRNTLIGLVAATMIISLVYRIVFEKLLMNSNLSTLYGIYSATGSGDSGGYITYHTLGMFVITLMVFVIAYIYMVVYKTRPVTKTSTEIGLITTWKYKKGKIIHKRERAEIRWSNSLLLYATYFAMLFRFSAFLINVTSRFALYFIPFIMVIVPYALQHNTKQNKGLMIGIYIVLTIFFLYILVFRAQGLWGMVPYRFFWEG